MNEKTPKKDYETDTCSRCGRELDTRKDGAFYQIKTDRLFCVQCALDCEGLGTDESVDEIIVGAAKAAPYIPSLKNGMYYSAAKLGKVIREDQFKIRENETDEDFQKRIFRTFVSRETKTHAELPSKLSRISGVEFVSILEAPNESIEIILIGKNINRQTVASTLHKNLPSIKTIGEVAETYNTLSFTDEMSMVEYCWSEYENPYRFFARFFAKSCPICGRDMGSYVDMCDLCYQIKDGLRMLENSPPKIGKTETLRRLGLIEISVFEEKLKTIDNWFASAVNSIFLNPLEKLVGALKEYDRQNDKIVKGEGGDEGEN
jgi:hypothetical protein